ncbi:MAG: hypothetical protein ACK5ZW_15860 [Betaproteobacteria bacterium]
MTLVIYVCSGLFFLRALALVFTWWRGRHPGALLLALTYSCAAGTALVMQHWWPLVIGFLSAWALRLMGMDPGQGAGKSPKS